MTFSILIPSYKAAFFKEAIESILAQTYTNFEVVIVNDNSPEDLDSIVLQFKDQRIHYYKNEVNCGAKNVVDNWNICLKYAHGDYIVCMGDDDKLKPIFLEEYYKMILKNPICNIFHARTELINEDSEVIEVLEERPDIESVYSMLYYRWKGRKQYIGDFLFKKESLIRNDCFYKIAYALGSDDISATIVAQDTGIININTPIFQYRVNSNTISNNGDARKLIGSALDLHDWYKQFLKDKPADKNDIYYWSCLNNMLDKRFFDLKYAIIARDYKKFSISDFIFWVNNRNKYGINILLVTKAFISRQFNIIKRVFFYKAFN